MSQRRGTRPVMVAAMVLALAGCAQDIRKSGYYPLEQDLAAVQIGGSRGDVVGLLGSPTVGDAGADSVIYYVGQQTQHIGPFAPRIVDRQIVAVSFDGRGKVANVVTYGLEDGQIVTLQSRITDPVGGDISLLKQMFGAIGNVNPAALL